MRQLFSAALAGACLFAGPAVEAATVTYALEATVARVQGPAQELLGTTGTGTLSYDDSRIDPLDQRLVGPDVNLSLTIFGTTWNETSDDNYPFFPWIEFVDNKPTRLDFTRSVDIDDPRIGLFSVMGNFVAQPDGSLAFNIGVQAVPLPATLSLLLGAAGLLGGLAYSRSANRLTHSA